MKISLVPIVALAFSVATAYAATFEDFTYTDDGDSITITDYPQDATGSVVIPASIDGKPVTSIGPWAFSGCSFTNITIPASVTSIGNGAMERNKSLTSITIPSGVLSIGDYTFYSCTSLSSVTLPASVTSIGDQSFIGCYSLTSITIPANVTSIAQYAFSECATLSKVTFLGNAPTLGVFVFKDVPPSFRIYFTDGNAGFTTPFWNGYPSTALNANQTFGNFTYTDDGVSISIKDYPTEATGSVVIPSAIDGKPVTNIGEGAFNNCQDLTSVTIPPSVTSIGESAFAYCSGLTSVTIPPSVRSIGEMAFYGCSGLTSVTIPSSVTSFGSYAFYGCTNLSKATFQGNAPAMVGTGLWFEGTAPSFKIYFMDGKAGFTTPTWQGYPSGAIYDSPEISIQQPVGSELIDGTAKKSFGSLKVNTKGGLKSFTIKNIGTKTLSGLSIKIDGANAKDFIVTQPLKASLAGGTSTTFKVSFKPTAKGTRNAVIHVKSNDANENPFDIKLTGSGVK